jgi:cell division protein FtsI (penicillin-binding protein 3)
MELNKNNTYKLYAVVIFLTLMAIGVFVKLTNIQIIEGKHYRELAKKSTIKSHIIAANKGNIYSADGSLLATSIPNYTLRFDAVAPKKEVFDEQINALSDSLAVIFGKPSYFYKTELKQARTNKNRYYFIAKNLNYSKYLRIKKLPLFKLGANKGGVIFEQKTIREHPIGLIAERTIGYERENEDGTFGGKGIEWSFRNYLNGKDGQRLMQKMGKGQWKPIRDENELDPKDGLDVYSTIDVYMQDIAHHALLKQLTHYEADHGCVVVMETKTGHVKAISNLGRDSNGDYYETINYAVAESHEPGSTFKLVNMIALLEDKLADTSTVFDTNGGKMFIQGKPITDSGEKNHGKVSLARGMELSLNTVMVKSIFQNYKANPKKYLAHLSNLYLDKPLDLQIKGAAKPYIPKTTDKSWSKLSLPWMGWGYGVSVTPLHTLILYNAIANDGVMVKPLFVSEIKEWDKTIKKFDAEVLNPSICSQENCNKIKKVLEHVVKRGTADKLYSKNFSMAGKTGTAKNAYDPDNKFYVSSFVGFFPVDKPKYSCIVVIHKPSINKGYYGADVSGPVFKSIAQKVFTDSPSLNEVKAQQIVENPFENKYNSFYKKLESATVPNVKGMPAMDAVALLENMGLNVNVQTTHKIKTQSLESGTPITKNLTIYLN